MKSKITITFFACCGLLSAKEKLPLSKDYWKDPVFLKEFNGSYRINANIEPILSGEQRAELIAMQKLMALGKRQDVIKKLKGSKFLNTSAAIQFNLGNVLTEEGQQEQAIAAYKKAISLLPSFRRAHQNLAYAYVKADNYKEALPHLLEVVSLGGNDGSVMGLLGYCYQQEEKYAAALAAFQRAQLTQPEVRDWVLGEAHCLRILERSNEALVLYLGLKKGEPDDTSIRLAVADLQLELGDRRQAIIELEWLRRKGRLDPENELMLGTLLLGEGSVGLGAKRLKSVIEAGELESVQPALNAIRYAIDLDLIKLADSLHTLIKEDSLVEPRQQLAYTRMQAEILLAIPATHKQGGDLLVKLTKKYPDDDHSLFLLGQYLFTEKRYEEAVLKLEQAMACNGNYYLPSLAEKAQVEVAQKMYDRAIKSLNDYLERRQDSQIEEYLEAIKNLQQAAQ